MSSLSIVASLCILVVGCLHVADSMPAKSSGCDFSSTKPESSKQVIKYGSNSVLTIDGYLKAFIGDQAQYLALTNAVDEHRSVDDHGLEIKVQFECANVTFSSKDMRHLFVQYDFPIAGGRIVGCPETSAVLLSPDGSSDWEREYICVDPRFKPESDFGVRFIKIEDNESK